MNSTRPSRTFATGSVTAWVRRIAVVLAIGLTVFLIVRFPALPETIPTHFTFTGEADQWGPRSMVLIFSVPLVTLVLGMAWLSSRPHVVNYPIVITDESAQSIYREGERMLVWLTVAVLLLYMGTAFASFGWTGSPLAAAGGLGIAMSLIIGITRIVAASRRPAADADQTAPTPKARPSR